jgi:hypothetical protein
MDNANPTVYRSTVRRRDDTLDELRNDDGRPDVIDELEVFGACTRAGAGPRITRARVASAHAAHVHRVASFAPCLSSRRVQRRSGT